MNRILFFALAVMGVILSGCSKEPYEDTIRKYYRDGAKMGIYLQTIKVDTVVSDERAKPYIEKRFATAKVRLTTSYEANWQQTKSEAAKQRLDSARQGLFSDKEYDIAYYKDLLSGKFHYEQITVNYKTWVQGETVSQVFISRISDRDTTLRITDKDITHFLTH
jgi:hypothetical protein